MSSPNTGMIIDGVFGSEAIDSSGEILDIAGCDISDLKEGKAVLNYEHMQPGETSLANGQEIVGKILTAKKIFGPQDCGNARELEYWNMLQLPFIYGIGRLYDGAGHAGAQGLAAQIRDHNANNEPILVRYSVEGTTLEREPGNKSHITKSLIRRVSLTIKPANKSASSGLILDPKAPEGFEKQPDPNKISGYTSSVQKGEENPMYTKVASAEFSYEPMLRGIPIDVLKSESSSIQKALDAGMGANTAPGSRVQYLQKVLGVLGNHKNKLLKQRVIKSLEKWDGSGEVEDYLASELKDLDKDQVIKLLGEVKSANIHKAELLIRKMESVNIEWSKLSHFEK